MTNEQLREERVESVLALWKKHFSDKMGVCPDCKGWSTLVCEKVMRDFIGALIGNFDRTTDKAVSQAVKEAVDSFKGNLKREWYVHGYREAVEEERERIAKIGEGMFKEDLTRYPECTWNSAIDEIVSAIHPHSKDKKDDPYHRHAKTCCRLNPCRCLCHSKDEKLPINTP